MRYRRYPHSASNLPTIFSRVPVEFMVEEDDTAPKEDATSAEDGKH